MYAFCGNGLTLRRPLRWFWPPCFAWCYLGCKSFSAPRSPACTLFIYIGIWL
ncbi:hypothetical protein DAQ1742_03510 [Dickeya aquatica]|uniref:Uncharacterized protein n=1 Tax=Dickeya aquatica TaxID=1401087 RepID=A0A375ADZ0_9GAMM|nr:hypothetical protein DAQ1742_03510 [Dickeya aquatica]